MVKIVTDEFLENIDEMSEYLTPSRYSEPCFNCYDVKLAVKNEDIKQVCKFTKCLEEETAGMMNRCKQCLWYWVDEVVKFDEEHPLTMESLREAHAHVVVNWFGSCRCSKCKKSIERKDHYCRNCGAKMDEPEEQEEFWKFIIWKSKRI